VDVLQLSEGRAEHTFIFSQHDNQPTLHRD
jgi:hypothetical protein